MSWGMPSLEGAGQLEELAGGLGFAVLVVQNLQGQAAADELGLKNVEDCHDSGCGVGFHRDRVSRSG